MSGTFGIRRFTYHGKAADRPVLEEGEPTPELIAREQQLLEASIWSGDMAIRGTRLENRSPSNREREAPITGDSASIPDHLPF